MGEAQANCCPALMPKKVKTHRPKGQPTRAEQNREYDARRRAEDAIRALYQTPAWKALRKIILARDPYCKRCDAKGLVTPATTVNHIKRSREHPELFFDETNLEGVCAPCHNSEIQKEERAGNAN